MEIITLLFCFIISILFLIIIIAFGGPELLEELEISLKEWKEYFREKGRSGNDGKRTEWLGFDYLFVYSIWHLY